MTPSDVGALERAGRYEQAASLAERLGDFARASRLWERALDLERAASAALEADDAARAFTLAARAHGSVHQALALDRLSGDATRAASVADALSRSRLHLAEARLRGAIGDLPGAAAALERAGRYVDAAQTFVDAGDAASALACLRRGLEATPLDGAARSALGALLGRLGAPADAARTLQALAAEGARATPSRDLALALWRAGAGPPADGAPAPPESLWFARYRVGRLVTRTASATTVLATDELTGLRVAIKALAPSVTAALPATVLDRYARDTRAVAHLEDAPIVRALAWLPGGPAVVTAWSEGGSLADRLRAGPLPPAHVARLARRVLSALDEAHRVGVVHGAVKPTNVLYDAVGAPYLADFGAHHVAHAAPTVTSTGSEAFAYLAPERREGHDPDPGTDVYAVGALLWHALTGAPPPEPPRVAAEGGLLGAARRLLAPAGERPTTARDALDAIAPALCIDDQPAPGGTAPSRPDEEPPATGERLVAVGASLFHDTLLERDVSIVPATPEALTLARAFARAEHPRLATVLRVAPPGGLWVEALPAARRDPTEADRAALASALRQLHGAGAAHGAVDRAHLC